MLALIVHLEARPGAADQLIAALEHNALHSRQEPGCLRWEWSRQVDCPDRFAIYEVYLDEAAIEAHRSSPHVDIWRHASADLLFSKSSATYRLSQGTS